MNPDHTHGSPLRDQPRACAHRPLAEDVMHSAREEVTGEVILHNRAAAPERPASVEKSGPNIAASEPLLASLLAMAAGAVLTLALQRRFARGKARA